MAKTVYKYDLVLEDKQVVKMPKGAQILSIQVQHHKPCIWALVNPTADLENRMFETYGTGHPIAELGDRSFVGTYQMSGGMLVWHVFEIKN